MACVNPFLADALKILNSPKRHAKTFKHNNH